MVVDVADVLILEIVQEVVVRTCQTPVQPGQRVSPTRASTLAHAESGGRSFVRGNTAWRMPPPSPRNVNGNGTMVFEAMDRPVPDLNNLAAISGLVAVTGATGGGGSQVVGQQVLGRSEPPGVPLHGEMAEELQAEFYACIERRGVDARSGAITSRQVARRQLSLEGDKGHPF